MRITNRKMGASVSAREEFSNNNKTVFAEWKNGKYVVYSYGRHWPMYIWDGKRWFANQDKYSVTTSKHAGQCHPGDMTMVRLGTEAMKALLKENN